VKKMMQNKEHYELVRMRTSKDPSRSLDFSVPRPKSPRQYAGELVDRLKSGEITKPRARALAGAWNNCMANLDVPVAQDLPTILGGVEYRNTGVEAFVVLGQGRGAIMILDECPVDPYVRV